MAKKSKGKSAEEQPLEKTLWAVQSGETTELDLSSFALPTPCRWIYVNSTNRPPFE
ncbi:hypothetical protein [Fibrisoma limi]|uniref:hypothetical protein n=1 Tax=Fibrisoma limi TaxID=663275 RepID=UPI001788C237|nr:hypothetical protein [Fibrisoma limi]